MFDLSVQQHVLPVVIILVMVTVGMELKVAQFRDVLSAPRVPLIGTLVHTLSFPLLTLLIGYPMAYAIARAEPGMRTPLLLLVILPFWTSFLIRVYAWSTLLQDQGMINSALMWLGVIDDPMRMLNTEFAVQPEVA